MKKIDTDVLTKIVQKYSNFINSICRRYYIVGGTQEDLYEEGVIGLLQACKDYNGDNLDEARFDAFAKMCIKRQIIDAMKNSNTNKNKVLNESLSLAELDVNGEEKSKLDTLLERVNMVDPLETILDMELIDEKLNICKNQLSDFEYKVFTYYFAGDKQSDIAKKLNRDAKSIDNTIQRIKAKLK